MTSEEGALTAWETCDIAPLARMRPCELWEYRVIEAGVTKRDDRDLWPREALAVDVTLRRAARWYESEARKQ